MPVLLVLVAPLLAAPAPTPPAAPAPAVPTAPAPTTLRWFQRGTPGTCAWMEAKPDLAAPRALATLPADCDLRSMSVSADGTRVAVTLGGVPFLLTPSLDGTLAATALPKPPVGDVTELGLDATGTLWALTLGGGTEAEGVLRFEGASFATDEVLDGLPSLAHAYAWRGGAWTREETVLTSTGWDYAEEARALQAYGRLVGKQGWAHRSGFLDYGYTGPAARPEPADAALTAALDKAGRVKTAPDEDEWQLAQAGGHRVAWWNRSVEGLVAAAPVLVEAGGQWREVVAPRAPDSLDPVRVHADGAWLLVAVYDRPAVVRSLADGRTTLLPATAVAPVLWPLP